MKRDDLFPSRYLKCADLKGRPRVLQVKDAPVETLKNPKGEEQRKAVLYFNGTKKSLPLNLTNFDAVAAIAGDDTQNWKGAKLELYPAKTTLGRDIVDCIRIRRPSEEPPKITAPTTEPTDEAADEFDEEIPF
jgi:hypothetical protein